MRQLKHVRTTSMHHHARAQMIASKMRPISTTRGTHVAKQGSDADCVYFLQRGTVEVLHLGRSVAAIEAPASFGEAALLKDDMDGADKRMSGYRTIATSMCALLPAVVGSLVQDVD